MKVCILKIAIAVCAQVLHGPNFEADDTYMTRTMTKVSFVLFLYAI